MPMIIPARPKFRAPHSGGGGGGGGGWTPTVLGTALGAWWKADAQVYNTGTTLATNGQTVSQWTDQSGNGVNLTPATAPIWLSAGLNSKPAVQFNAAGNLDKISCFSPGIPVGSGSKSYAVFAIGAQQTGADGLGSAFSGLGISLVDNGGSYDATSLMPKASTTELGVVNDTTALTSTTSFALNTSSRFGFNADGTNTTLYFNGASVGSGAARATLQATQGFQVNNSQASGWLGPISEIIVVTRALTGPELTSLDAYLASRQ